ncbi:copper resistance CopC family protein [Catenuloplanes indicus]|uniref:Methionine-rich copper-binding protein CopC n=1 Tax=Catenuloplanes indicus TaxID=137267 RepID=A0AAE4AW63_9ACTN|nr:copper resistance CopC family protein [Catenuloplanes indicus]MDQ0364396.1 methionine-rich copper-binding protein CopC [Catenuloplanes indicus]
MIARRLLTVLVLAAVTSPLPAPASARAADRVVVATAPADGAALTVPPGEVVIRTAGRPDLYRSHLSVQDDTGAAVAAGELGAGSPRALTLPVRLDGAGTFTAVYHVELADGRESSGVVRFSVGTGVPPAAGPAAAGHEHGIDPLSAVLLTVDLLVLAGALLLLRLRPRPGTPPGDRPRWRL